MIQIVGAQQRLKERWYAGNDIGLLFHQKLCIGFDCELRH